jgi:hypothetical protein
VATTIKGGQFYLDLMRLAVKFSTSGLWWPNFFVASA